jgi:hypothetical protein
MNFNILDYTNFKLNNSSSLNRTNDISISEKPKLVDNGVKYFFKEVLKGCHNYKQKNYNTFFNASMLILFVLVLTSILFMRHKGNKSSMEYYEKSMKDKDYIMSKLIYYNRQNIDNQQKIKNNMITNLPDYSNHVEANLLHKTIYFS